MNRKKGNKNKKAEKLNYQKSTFAVIQFRENDGKLFECIPDLWFVNGDKELCYWPPKSGKSPTLRAMNQDIPDEDWELYECEVVSSGHATYSIGSGIVREKCSQHYNTSSADEHLQAEKFRREHPALINKTFENVFAAAKEAKTKKDKGKDNRGSFNEAREETNSHTAIENHPQLSNNNYSKSGRSHSRSDTNTLSQSGHSHSHLALKDHSKSDRSFHSRSASKDRSKSGKCSHSRSGSENHQQTDRSRSNSGSKNQPQIDRICHSSSGRGHSPSDSKNRSQPEKCCPSHSVSQSHSRSASKDHSKSDISVHSRSRSKSQPQADRSHRSRSASKAHLESHRSSHSHSGSKNQLQTGRNHCSRSVSENQQSIRSVYSRSASKSHSKSHRSSHARSRSKNQSHSDIHSHPRSGIGHSPSDSKNQSQPERSCHSRSYSQSQSQSDRSVHSRAASKAYLKSHRSFRSRSVSKPYSLSSKSSNRSRTSYDPRSSMCSRSHSRSKTSRRSRRRTRSRSMLRSNSRFRQSTSYSTYNTLQNLSSTDHQKRLYTRQVKNATTKRQHENIRRPNIRASPSSPRRLQHLMIPSADGNYRGIASQNIPRANVLLETLITEVKKLTNTVTKNNRRFDENDRRFARMEVTVNKTFIMLGDMTHAVNTRMSVGNSLAKDVRLPRGYHVPRLPIKRIQELFILNRDLKNKEFFSFLIEDQKDFCSSSNATDTVVMTAYLKRFISVDIRASLVLKELKGQLGLTLYKDFHRVYLFLIAVMKAGYLIRNKVITDGEVHVILRVVWGRSKQLLAEENKRN